MGEESLEIVKKRLRARFQGGSTQTARDVMKLIQELEEALSDRAGMRDERESAIRECLSLQERHEAHKHTIQSLSEELSEAKRRTGDHPCGFGQVGGEEL